MFNSIQGIITTKTGETVHLLTGGVEWEIAVTRQSLRQLPATGQEARVFIHLLHREDQMRLFGFATEQERGLFLKLLKVEGVGPKVALKILSGVEAAELYAAINREDVDALCRIPGLGRKTAQKVILALKGELPEPAGEAGADTAVEELAQALTGMGFDRRKVRDALRAAAAELDRERDKYPQYEQELLRRALGLLGQAAGGEGARP